MRIEPSPALAIAIVIAAALIAFASIRSDRAEPFASPSENSLKFELALCNAERFEKRHQLNSRFGDCNQVDHSARYTCNLVLDGRPASYTCDYQNCQWIPFGHDK